MKNLKISIIGNSVGLRIRPPGVYPDNKNYGMIIEKMLQDEFPDMCVIVNNMCIGRATIWDLLERKNDILNQFPDYYIINLGVSDASTREIPLWYSNIINNNSISLKKKIFTVFHEYIIKRWRSQLVILFGKRTWTSKKNYKKYFDHLIHFLIKGTNAKCIILSINKPTRRIESEIPGSSNNYREFNLIMKKVSEKYGSDYIDTSDLVPDIHSPDGIHLSIAGHEIIADKIFKHLIKYESAK